MATRIIAFFLISAVLGALWYAGTGSADGGLKLPAEFAGYRKWTQVLKSPYEVPLEFWIRCVAATPDDWKEASKKYGPHTRRYIRVYANPAAEKAFSKGASRRFPQGAVIAKEKLWQSPQGEPDGVGIMVKRKSPQFSETGGWEFLYFPSGDTQRTHKECAACHRSAASRDYVFGEYPR